MAKFIFRLQGLLKIKEKLEEQKKLELGNATIYLNQQVIVSEGLKVELSKLLEEFNHTQGKSLYPLELIRLNKAIKYYEDELVAQKLVIQKAEKAVVLKREELNAAIIERKTYEKLKEIEFENYLKELNQAEFKQLDEVVSYKYSK